MPSTEKIRNVAIIAHVDHGKTTLVDCLLRRSGTFRDGADVPERVMDSNDLERERGITILAKNTSLSWNGFKVNIVDTPGHADFGGEVERTLHMVDAALVVIDAVEGPMPQTRFVLLKALGLGLKPIVVVNKVDRPEARSEEVVDELFDLMIDLGASDEQAEFAVIYASARDGWSSTSHDEVGTDMAPLLDTIVRECPPPPGDAARSLRLLVAALAHDPYVGRLAIGRLRDGQITAGSAVAVARPDGTSVAGRVAKLYTFDGLERRETLEATAGDIAAVAGFDGVQIGETLCSPDDVEALPSIAVEEPTLSMQFLVNDSPFAGQEGSYVTSRQIGERLEKELRTNVALRVAPGSTPDAFEVSGRGELHLSVLVENMRREGFELGLSRPEVITRPGPNGETCEPWELLLIDVDEEHTGRVIELLSERGGELQDLHNDGSGRARITFHIPTRGIIGFRSTFLTETRGSGILHANHLDYRPVRGARMPRGQGVMVAKEGGDTTAYAIEGLEERGYLFLPPGERVYGGQIVGRHTRNNDIVVNPCKKKHLTNIRSSTSDIEVKLTPFTVLTLEQAINLIVDDELAEVTPKSLRLRKKTLDHSMRKLEESRRAKAAAAAG